MQYVIVVWACLCYVHNYCRRSMAHHTYLTHVPSLIISYAQATDLSAAFDKLGVSSVEDMSKQEVDKLVADIDDITKEKAEAIVDKAKETALFNKRKEAITSTWKAVGDSLGVEATKLFYKRLFEQYPDVVPLFGGADMDKQADKLLQTISVAVDYLTKIDELVPILQNLGKRHALEWEVKKEHYDAVGECLIWTLKTGLGDAFTDALVFFNFGDHQYRQTTGTGT